MEKFLGIFPRIFRNFSINIPRNIHSETPFFLRKNSELYCYGKFTRN
jgi:hypothetical protein